MYKYDWACLRIYFDYTLIHNVLQNVDICFLLNWPEFINMPSIFVLKAVLPSWWQRKGSTGYKRPRQQIGELAEMLYDWKLLKCTINPTKAQ